MALFRTRTLLSIRDEVLGAQNLMCGAKLYLDGTEQHTQMCSCCSAVSNTEHIARNTTYDTGGHGCYPNHLQGKLSKIKKLTHRVVNLIFSMVHLM